MVGWGWGRRLDLLEHQFETLDGQSRRGHPPTSPPPPPPSPPATNPAPNPRVPLNLFPLPPKKRFFWEQNTEEVKAETQELLRF